MRKAVASDLVSRAFASRKRPSGRVLGDLQATGICYLLALNIDLAPVRQARAWKAKRVPMRWRNMSWRRAAGCANHERTGQK